MGPPSYGAGQKRRQVCHALCRPFSISIRQLNHVEVHTARVGAIDRAVGIMLKSVAKAEPPEWHDARPGRRDELKGPTKIVPSKVMRAYEGAPQARVNGEPAVFRTESQDRRNGTDQRDLLQGGHRTRACDESGADAPT